MAATSLHQHSPSSGRRLRVAVSQHARLTPICELQMNDMLSGGPTLSGRSALEQMGDTNDPVEIFDGEEKAVTATIMASAMATDRGRRRARRATQGQHAPQRPALRYVPVQSLGRRLHEAILVQSLP